MQSLWKRVPKTARSKRFTKMEQFSCDAWFYHWVQSAMLCDFVVQMLQKKMNLQIEHLLLLFLLIVLGQIKPVYTIYILLYLPVIKIIIVRKSFHVYALIERSLLSFLLPSKNFNLIDMSPWILLTGDKREHKQAERML